jgi:hypothetical protein
MMHGDGKSHSPIIPTKPPNEAGAEAKEAVEGRGLAKGKTLKCNRFRTQSRQILSNTLERIRQARTKDGSERGYHSYSSTLFFYQHWRYDPRQEPDAAIPHVRIRAGGRP